MARHPHLFELLLARHPSKHSKSAKTGSVQCVCHATLLARNNLEGDYANLQNAPSINRIVDLNVVLLNTNSSVQMVLTSFQDLTKARILILHLSYCVWILEQMLVHLEDQTSAMPWQNEVP